MIIIERGAGARGQESGLTNLVVLSDSQGYATGDLDKDAFAVRYFANERGMELMVTQVTTDPQ